MNNDKRYMKRCYELAVQAGKKGFDTFGAVLVHDGEIIEEAENTADWKYYWLRLPPYPGDIVIDTENKGIREIVREMRKYIGQPAHR